MPFLFEAVGDEADLLLPDNLTRTHSILRGLVDGIPEERTGKTLRLSAGYISSISLRKRYRYWQGGKDEDIPAATAAVHPKLDCTVSGCKLPSAASGCRPTRTRR